MKVKEIWRYPFKSMGGEQLESATFGAHGIPGDRAFALRQDNNTRGAKKFPSLMAMKAWYDGDPESSVPRVQFENGDTFTVGTDEFALAVRKEFGDDVSVSGVAPKTDLDFYRRAPSTEEELRATFGVIDGEPLPPDLVKLPSQVFEFESPPGTFFDACSLLVMTTASLAALQAAATESNIDVRRFRPNILIDTDENGFVEQEWVGRKLRLGDVVLSVDAPCPRCVMTTIGFDDLPKDPKIMRTLVQVCQQNLGVYAEVEAGGDIRVGDTAEIE